jgi:hypothetical protein
MTAVDRLLQLASAEVCEALQVGYLAGATFGNVALNGRCVAEWVQHIVTCFGLADRVAHNLSFGYVTTERATVALEDSVAQ